MAAKNKSKDPILEELKTIKCLLQDLLIIMAARSGISKVEARKLVGVADFRLTGIWKHIDTEK